MTILRRVSGALVVIVALPLTATTLIPANASALASASSLAKDLLPPSYADKIGFTNVVEKAATGKTDNKSCPLVAQEMFENAKGTMELISGAATCTTSQGALRNARFGTSASSATPPTQLGSSALERKSPGAVYEIYWLRGLTLEVVEIAAVPPTSSRHGRQITSAQQKLLSSAALEQNKLQSDR